MSRTDNQQTIDALLAERAGYERRRLKDRVGQVDEELKRLGCTPPSSEGDDKGEKTAQQPAEPPRGRRTAGRDSA